jgi:hypothetical protein
MAKVIKLSKPGPQEALESINSIIEAVNTHKNHDLNNIPVDMLLSELRSVKKYIVATVKIFS